MKTHKLELLHDAERSWWYRGRRLVVEALLRRKGVRGNSALDFGAGFGAMCESLSSFCRQVYAFEPDPMALRSAHTHRYERIFPSDTEALGRTYDLVALFDVLEHIEDDGGFLRTLHTSLTDNGRLILTVPAYQFLWSEHDVGNQHFRRYTKHALVRLLKESGYEVEYASYWNMFLFLPAACMRLMGKAGGEALRLPAWINAILLLVIRVEALMMRIFPLPFGLSVVVLAKRCTTPSVKRVCYFGDYDPEYNRTKVLMQGLRENGVEVVECREDPRTPMVKKCIQLYRAYCLIGPHDAVVLGFSSTRWMPLYARIITRKKIVWDMLFSFYDNWVFDRKIVKQWSPKALYHWCLDWFLPHCVDKVIFHTYAEIERFADQFGVSRKRFARVILGADTSIFYPRPRRDDGMFRVEYHGGYIPVHGTETIIRAAKLLERESVQFTMIGRGQEKNRIEALAKTLCLTNVEFLDFLPTKELVPYIAAADVCIGLLGDVPRVEESIANKMYENAAMARVSINADTKGVRECFQDGKDVVLVKKADPLALARAIRSLQKDPAYKHRLESGVLETFRRTASTKEVGRQLLAVISETLGVEYLGAV